MRIRQCFSRRLAIKFSSSLAALLMVSAILAPTAQAFVFVVPTPSFPLSTVVGQTFSATLGITNSSTPPETVNNPVLTISFIDLYPACSNGSTDCNTGTAEAGVFALSATGTGSSTPAGDASCEGTWTLTSDTGNPTTATRYRFVPPGGEGTLLLATGGTCAVAFSALTRRAPSIDPFPGTPGAQTFVTAASTATGTTIGSTRNGSATTTTVAQAVPPLTTVASQSGPQVPGTTFDTATLNPAAPPSSGNGIAPAGTMTFSLYSNLGCTVMVGSPDFVAVTGFGNTVSPTRAITTPGTYYWVASYSGDANYLGTSTACGDPAETVTFASATLPTIQVDKTATPLTRPEPGGSYTFNIVVTNTSNEALTITSLTDNVYGTLANQGTCTTAIGTVLAAAPGPGNTYPCSFAGSFFGNAGAAQTDVVTATATSGTGAIATDSDDAVVSITDVPPTLQVDKTPTPLSRPAPGGSFTYAVVITNTSTEPVTITALTDNVYGDLNGRGTCAIGAVVAPSGGSFSCSFPGTFTGVAGASLTDVVTAVAVDDDGTSVTATDSATVTLTPGPTLTTQASTNAVAVAPGTSVTDTATVTPPAGGPTPTGTVTYTLVGPNPNAGCTAPVFGAPSTVALGNPSAAFSPTAVGSYNFLATYSGDANYATITNVGCGVPAEMFSIALQPTLTTQASGTVRLGGTVSDTAMLTGGASPTGTVTFMLYGPNDPNCTGVAVFSNTKTLVNGTATSDNFTPTTSGVFRWIATYNGDANNAAVSAPCNEPNELVNVTMSGGDDGDEITVDATAAPDPRDAPGGEFKITVKITNTGDHTVKIDSITDNVYGNLATRDNSDCDDLIGDNLAQGSSASCSFTVNFFGPPGASQTSTVRVVAIGSIVIDTDEVTLRIRDNGLFGFNGFGNGLGNFFNSLLPSPLRSGQVDGSRSPIIITNNNSSSSSSSAAAAAGGATVEAKAAEAKAAAPAAATQARPAAQNLARTGSNVLAVTALGLLLAIAGFVMRRRDPATDE